VSERELQRAAVLSGVVERECSSKQAAERFLSDLCALPPDHPSQPLWVFGVSPTVPDGYVETHTAGVEQTLGDIVLNPVHPGRLFPVATQA
jgi:hypothetical protein